MKPSDRPIRGRAGSATITMRLAMSIRSGRSERSAFEPSRGHRYPCKALGAILGLGAPGPGDTRNAVGENFLQRCPSIVSTAERTWYGVLRYIPSSCF